MNQSIPLVSVCIANFNGAEDLSPCLDSVLMQTGDFRLEIIVHDDASTDNSLQLLANFYPTIRLISSPTNVGFCISNNRMVAQAKGDYLLFLNNDARLRPNSIAALCRFAQSGHSEDILGLPQYTLTERLSRNWKNSLF